MRWISGLMGVLAMVGCSLEGEPGVDGMDGAPGMDGMAGMAGLSCWDVDADGTCDDGAEDINNDGVCDALDCIGPEGPAGSDGATGPTGPEGPAGPAGPSGVVASASASGFGLNPTATRDFLAVPAIVTVVFGEVVHVTSHKAFGSAAVGGASSLDLYICYREVGATAEPTTVGFGTLNQQVPQNTRVVMGLSHTIEGLDGQYDFGLCGDDDGDGNWNSNEYGYTSVLVFTE